MQRTKLKSYQRYTKLPGSFTKNLLLLDCLSLNSQQIQYRLEESQHSGFGQLQPASTRCGGSPTLSSGAACEQQTSHSSGVEHLPLPRAQNRGWEGPRNKDSKTEEQWQCWHSNFISFPEGRGLPTMLLRKWVIKKKKKKNCGKDRYFMSDYCLG